MQIPEAEPIPEIPDCLSVTATVNIVPSWHAIVPETLGAAATPELTSTREIHAFSS
jgi:hypothetical protein